MTGFRGGLGAGNIRYHITTCRSVARRVIHVVGNPTRRTPADQRECLNREMPRSVAILCSATNTNRGRAALRMSGSEPTFLNPCWSSLT